MDVMKLLRHISKVVSWGLSALTKLKKEVSW